MFREKEFTKLQNELQETLKHYNIQYIYKEILHQYKN